MADGQSIVDLARQYLGTQYAWGGSSPGGFDCSGLVQYVFGKNGVQLPRVTYDQINVGYSVEPNKLRVGDLVFFDTDRSQKGPDHVGIYIGGGKFIHAPAPGQGVKISSLADSYYMDRWMGGRRVPGVSGAPEAGGGSAEAVAPRLDATELAETYGMSYAFFKSQPELWKLLNQAVEGQWTGSKFQAEIKNTGWWKNNSDTMRQAQTLAKTDPATYKAQMEAARVAAQQIAVKAGATLSAANLDRLATNMITLNWNEAQVSNFVGQYVKFGDDYTMGGMAGQAANAIRKTAYDLGIAVTHQSVLNNAQYLVRGLTTMDNVTGSLRQQAAGLYPAFAPQITAGASVQDIAQPYVQVLANELGLSPRDVDVFNPKIKSALNRADDRGNPSPMSLDDFTTMVRNDPRWRQTPQAANQVMAVGRQVLSAMGLGG